MPHPWLREPSYRWNTSVCNAAGPTEGAEEQDELHEESAGSNDGDRETHDPAQSQSPHSASPPAVEASSSSTPGVSTNGVKKPKSGQSSQKDRPKDKDKDKEKQSKPHRSFQRPKLKGTACAACRKSKLKCDEGQPCAPCSRRRVECLRDSQVRMFRSSLDYLSAIPGPSVPGGLPLTAAQAAEVHSNAAVAHAHAAHAAQLASLRHANFEREREERTFSAEGKPLPPSRMHSHHSQQQQPHPSTSPRAANGTRPQQPSAPAPVMPQDVKPTIPANPSGPGSATSARPRTSGSGRSPRSAHHQALGPSWLPAMQHYPPSHHHHHLAGAPPPHANGASPLPHHHHVGLPPLYPQHHPMHISSHPHSPWQRYGHSPPSAHRPGFSPPGAGPGAEVRLLPQQAFANWRPASYPGPSELHQRPRKEEDARTLPSLKDAVGVKQEEDAVDSATSNGIGESKKEVLAGGLPMASKTSSRDSEPAAAAVVVPAGRPHSRSPPSASMAYRDKHSPTTGTTASFGAETVATSPYSAGRAPPSGSLSGLLNDGDGGQGGQEFPAYLAPWKAMLVDAGIESMHSLREEIAPEMVRDYADYLADVSSHLCRRKQASKADAQSRLTRKESRTLPRDSSSNSPSRRLSGVPTGGLPTRCNSSTMVT